MNGFFENVCVAIFAIVVGNYLGDQATIRDCATKGEAQMIGGGTVMCSVKKETL